MNKNILVADVSPYKDEIREIFSELEWNCIFCDSAFDAISKLNAHDIDLVISEVELPGDNAFDLYEYIQDKYPYIPVVMVTDKNIDTFFDKIFTQGIGNVLHKPVNRKELINLSQKLVTLKNIFGIKNYFDGIDQIKKISINKSKQIKKAVELIFYQIEEWGFEIESKTTLNLILNEMIINAVYHSHGLTEEKLNRVPVELEEGKCVDIHFSTTGSSYAISITDYNGKLTKNRILESINKVVMQHQLIEKAVENGEDITSLISETGRGIDLVRKLSGEYYFIIKEGYRTEIILRFYKSENTTNEEFTSLKIIEDRD